MGTGTAQRLLGHVVVVAGDADVLAAVAATATDAGASVAVVSQSLPSSIPATVRFSADPGDPAAWGRIAMHVEQHLGPVDGVVCDGVVAAVVRSAFTDDLARRRRGPVVVAQPGDDADDVVTRLCCRPPATPSRPGGAGPDR